jgi:hypothetical protein
MPQRLHGSLLNCPDRWRAGLELSEAESLQSLASVPERRESNRAGYARGSRVEHSCDASGPSFACAKRGCGASGGGTATRHCAAKFCWHKQA